MKLKTVLLAGAAAMMGVSAAQAQSYEGLYAKIGAGLNYVAPDRDFDGDADFNADGEFDYDNGIAVITAIGYDYGKLRGEFEYSYRTNDIRQIDSGTPNFSGFSESDISGDVKSHSIMANLIYDFDYVRQSTSLPVTPYIGGGVGLAFIDYDITGSVATAPGALVAPGFNSINLDGTERSFTFQGIAGVAIELDENVGIDLEYRYVGYPKRGIPTTLNTTNGDIFTTLNSHTLLAALRWNFGAPAAAPAPAPAPVQYKDCWDGSSVPVSSSCPVEPIEEIDETPDPLQTTVYFDYDKSNLTPEASSLIREAANRARQFNVDRVTVVGNTDTSGGSAYNQALSERRARVVRDALIAQGISASSISMDARGETNLAKATPDGTREPLNRRSDITIFFE